MSAFLITVQVLSAALAFAAALALLAALSATALFFVFRGRITRYLAGDLGLSEQEHDDVLGINPFDGGDA